MTIFDRFIEHVDKRPDAEAVVYISNNQKYTLSWKQVFQYCNSYAQGLKALGVDKGQSVVIYSDTCKEWGFLDMAIMGLGAVTVPIYHSSHQEDVSYILEHCGADIVFVQNLALLERLKKSSRWDELKKIILLTETTEKNHKITTLRDFAKKGEAFSLREACHSLDEEDQATVIYTSGTSGTPKGVVLTHRQIISCVSEVYPLLGITNQDRSLTFLPFSHVLGRQELWGSYFTGFTIGYAESIERIKKNLPQIQPTVFVGVPRIYEKIYYGIQAQITLSKVKQKVFEKALAVGKKVIEYKQRRKSPPLPLVVQYQLAKRTVFSSIIERLGGRLRFAVSGGAPLDPEIATFFEACGITLLEGYGLTESTGPIFVNTVFENKVGTVGKAIGEAKIKFDQDGEILLKSDKIMVGYYKDETSTKKAFTEDGYFRTGDIGSLDKDGFLKITDRKKDLIKTAGGKFIAPQKLQNYFATSPLIGHVHVHGDKKKYVVALVTLEKDGLHSLRSKYELNGADFKDLIKHPKIEAEVRKTVSQINRKLASFETIKRYEVLDHEFTIEGGQLTPSLKMKRKKIDELYADNIKALYE